ncbi:amino acid permease [Luteimonas sp. BDR2-5]|uniref:APC family permease n=1 Tax=Proluteimonas luteida TaxID=2878685 RepID=UPI001E4C1C43|nr:amino acid permease [Luteimonas sp. BDR2-5]MCD9028275.1 amino acid permease [Luteimonas sp. BDR2-5]
MDARERRPSPAEAVLSRATLRARDAFAITIGIVVGAGIFRTPSLIAGASGSELVMLLAWVAGGALSIVGALCYAELATTYPQAGGDYNYLRRAYGPRLGFLFAWARVSVIQTGSIALLSFIVGDYMAQLLDIGPWSPALYAAMAVVALTTINWIGTRQGTAVQTWLTVAEIVGVLVIVVAGLLLAPPDIAPVPGSGGDSAIGLILVFVLLTYGGWNEAVYVTSEVRDARKWMPRVLVLSLIAIAALYVLVNLAYLRVLGLGGMAEHHAVAAEVMGRVFGPTGAVLMSVIVVAAALTSANATLITGARSVYAVGRDFPALDFIGRWDARSGTPRAAILAQGGLALALVGLGAFARDGFEVAVEYTAPVFWLFFLLVGISLFVLRRRDPDLPRPFRVPLFPVLPLLFCATSAYLLYSSLAYTGRGALVGVAVLGIGALLLLWFQPAIRNEESLP